MKQLSNIQKLRIIVQVINELKEIPNKDFLYVDKYNNNDLLIKIAKKSKISISSNRECGYVDIGEYIQITIEELESRLFTKINKIEPKFHHKMEQRNPLFPVSEDLKIQTDKFIKNNIPESGESNTLIGEIFRALQYIEYRAHNDGDLPWNIFSPSFISYMFVISQIDKLNWSTYAYNEETGEYNFKFHDEWLQKYNPYGKIDYVIESNLACETNSIRYEIMDLLLSGKLMDSENKYDSRSYRIIKQHRNYES